MSKPRILVVEDEAITALDIRSRLERSGYSVSAIASSAAQAVTQLSDSGSDLVLMDIRLQGEMDGIQAAEAIHARFGTPVVYLTAYADRDTLERAKRTEPYGYLLKPFEEKEIQTTIEMALYKHQMEKKVRDSEQWLSTTLRSIGDGVIATDAHGLVKFVNPVASLLTGWTQEEALGQAITRIVTITEEKSGAPFDNPVMGALAGNRVVVLEADCVLVAKDGSMIPIDDSAAPIRDDSGRVIGAVMVFRDITERRRAARALQQQAADLQEQNGELDAFAHTVAHDLKDPLNLVIGFSDLLAEDHADLPPDEVERCLRTVSTTARRMDSIIDELFLLSQVRKVQVQPEPLDMKQVVMAAHDRLLHLITARQAQIIWPKTWPRAVGHAPWVEEVWVNLLSNAVKYGGQPPRIELGAEKQANMVRFWVHDNGNGVPPGDQEQLFRPFTRLGQTKAKGHGLGLSVVRRIMDRLGGKVGVESSGLPGQGSLFYFLLPHADG
jgi:PAS domain S-box-containing protein